MPAAVVLTEKDREAAQTMYAFGIPEEQIARILKMDVDTLIKRLGKEMKDYKVKANSRVAATLYQMAISGTQPAATFFWLKTRAGWRETDRLEIESRNVNINVNTDAASYDTVIARLDEMRSRSVNLEGTPVRAPLPAPHVDIEP